MHSHQWQSAEKLYHFSLPYLKENLTGGWREMAYAINYKESITSNDAMHIPALSETQGELEGSTVKCNGTEQWPSSPRLGLSKNCCGL